MYSFKGPAVIGWELVGGKLVKKNERKERQGDTGNKVPYHRRAEGSKYDTQTSVNHHHCNGIKSLQPRN
jgi:hypothetical protein